ncbi:MAG: hypothetical protein AMJ93_11515 [Anaerolineae bacterium SM23_84]|nr:MAG: hypothetical protein AMJ93_11515 [Anaerolineae bacterium SM23_84]
MRVDLSQLGGLLPDQLYGDLQRILGHSDNKTTMIYVNLARVGLREAHAKASRVGNFLGA